MTIELVPRTAWYKNLRSHLDPSQWRKLRQQTLAKYQHRCGICGTQSQLHCHEQWQYDDEKHIQRLVGLIALCPMCHHVKHIGLAGVLAKRNELDFEKVIEHFLKINNCDRETFDQHYKNAFALWHERSKYDWQTDLSLLETINN